MDACVGCMQAEACLKVPGDISGAVQLAEDVYGPFTGHCVCLFELLRKGLRRCPIGRTRLCCYMQADACLSVPGEASGAVQLAEDVYGPFTGQVTAVARHAFRRAVMEADPRLVEAMFLCEVTTASEALSGSMVRVLIDTMLIGYMCIYIYIWVYVICICIYVCVYT